MIHYHGLPITPETAALTAIKGGHAFVSFAHPDQLGAAVAVAQSFALDNGAFSAWTAGRPITNWEPYYAWASNCLLIPSCDWAVIPDVIDGSEDDNDALLDAWPLPRWHGVPVWHLHESLERLSHLSRNWPRIAFGSSGEFASIGTRQWWQRMGQAMRTVCDFAGRPVCKLHGLRMLDPEVFGAFPFASADSTNVGRNIGIDQAWRGTYQPKTKEGRAAVMRERIESTNAPARWDFRVHEQAGIFALGEIA